MRSELAFFSFIRLTDPSVHAEYNRWHQLDHRPENLALPGILWGDRWLHTAEHDELTTASDAFAGTDSVAMYWFADPAPESVRRWDALGETTFQWGRGPFVPGVERPLLAFFRPVKGYAAPRALVSADVLPYRPNRGLHVQLTSTDEPHSSAVHDTYVREDQELIPEILELDGVAGVWTFSFSHAQRHSTLPFDGSPERPLGSMRVRVTYLEDDPVQVAGEIARVDAAADVLGDVRAVEFAAPVKTIIPWQDW